MARSARRAASFWKVFPNGPGFEAAQAAFLSALTEKDLSYLMFSLQQGVTGDMQKMQNAIAVTADPFGFDPNTPRDLNAFPTGVDGGIRPFAFPLYVEWVNALRRAQGRDKDGQWAQPQIIAEAVRGQVALAQGIRRCAELGGVPDAAVWIFRST